MIFAPLVEETPLRDLPRCFEATVHSHPSVGVSIRDLASTSMLRRAGNLKIISESASD